MSDICYNCRFVCYDCLYGNGYCNNKLSDNYQRVIINDRNGCIVDNCQNFDHVCDDNDGEIDNVIKSLFIN